MKKKQFKRDFDYWIDEYMYNCRSRKLRPKTMQSTENQSVYVSFLSSDSREKAVKQTAQWNSPSFCILEKHTFSQ